MLEELHKPRVIEAAEVVAVVRVEHPPHPPTLDPDRERVPRMMLGAPGPKPVGETDEVLLIDRVQHLGHRPLEDLVFQRSDPERPQPPVLLRYVRPTRRFRPIRASVNASMEIPEVALQLLPVFLPRHTVDAGGSARADRPARRLQPLHGHVMQKRGEPHALIPSRHLAHAIQITSHAQPGTASGTCFAGRVPLGWSPSLHRLRPRLPGLVRQLLRYYATIRLPAIVHQGITATAFPLRPAQRRSATPRTIQDGASSAPAGNRRTSRFSA